MAVDPADIAVAADPRLSRDPRSTHPVANALEAFVEELRGLREMMPVLSRTASEAEETAREHKQQVLASTPRRFFEDSRARSKEERHRLPDRMRTALLRPRVAATGWMNAKRDLSSAVLLMMSAHFDRFVGDMVKAAFEIKPELRNALKRNLSFSDFADLPDIEAVYRLVIEKEIEQILRDSRIAQIRWFNSRCGMPLPEEALTAELSDVAELRNLVAHHGGQVTNRVGFGFQNRESALLVRYSAGEQVVITNDDIAYIHDVLFIAAVSIAQGVWRNLRSDERPSADQDLHELTYSRLALDEFTLAQRALLVTSAFFDTMTDTARLVHTVNLAQTYKWLGDQQGCNKAIQDEDWTQHEPAFQFAVAVLRDEWELAESLMDRCVQEEEVSRGEFENWPALREFRESDHYKRVFERAYGV